MPSLSPKRGDDKRGDEIGLMVQHRSTAHAVIASSTLLFLLVLLRGGSVGEQVGGGSGIKWRERTIERWRLQRHRPGRIASEHVSWCLYLRNKMRRVQHHVRAE